MNTARHREDPVPLVIRSTTESIHAAVVRLRTGGVVAFPTETVYGLGADAGNAAAVAKIFELKGRPADHPLIVHLASALALAAWAAVVPPAAARLAALFWPGPLTMILPRAPGVMDAVTGGQATVGVRCPAHPLALQLLRECAKQGIAGLAAPSANRFGHVSPTTAAHVRAEFGADLMVLDGGPAAVGIESTIVDLSGVAPRILRPGVITEAQIAEALGIALSQVLEAAPRVSGSLAAHYAPTTALEIVDQMQLGARLAQAFIDGQRAVLLARHPVAATFATRAQVLEMPTDEAGYAQQLYAKLREADALALDLIVVEALPADARWVALNDRLQRAAHGAGRRH